MAANPTPRVSVAVINDHLPGLVEAGFRKSPFMYYLRKRGRIAYNAHSHTFDWRMRKRRNTITATSDMTPRTFKNVNRFKTAQLTYVIWRSTSRKSSGKWRRTPERPSSRSCPAW